MQVNIAENIRRLRKEHSMTQEQVANALGVTVGAVYKWESGQSLPEIRLLMEIADLFETSVDALLGYEYKTHGYYDDRYKEDEYFWGVQPNEGHKLVAKLEERQC